jgi:ubiquinone/menaquinone biosynthesis C-methylase UbiE
MTPERFHEHAKSFEGAADSYERARPSYPADAVEWLLQHSPRRVLDLGAGTGKLTRLIVDRAAQVIAVDPAPSMLAELSRVLPSVDARVGVAEDLPLDDTSVDAVLCAQAWHWVDAARAVPELDRVLDPGGTVGMLWNSRDESEAWVAALTDLFPRAHGGWTLAQIARLGAPFGEPEERVVEWSEQIDSDGLCALVSTWSQYLVLGESDREAMLDRVRELVATHPDLAGAAHWTIPYRTHCFRSRRYA